jgi:hypothetical protein
MPLVRPEGLAAAADRTQECQAGPERSARGWWRIDPKTGKPLEQERSKLSRPPDFVLLNAVPGVDDSADASYLGDGPGDMVADAVRQITTDGSAGASPSRTGS